MNLSRIAKTLLRMSVDLSRRLVYGAQLIEGKIFVTDSYCAALVMLDDPNVVAELYDVLRNAQADYSKVHNCRVIDRRISMSTIMSIFTKSERGETYVSAENMQKVCNVLKSFGSCIEVCSHGPSDPLELSVNAPGAIVSCVIAPIHMGTRRGRR